MAKDIHLWPWILTNIATKWDKSSLFTVSIIEYPFPNLRINRRQLPCTNTI